MIRVILEERLGRPDERRQLDEIDRAVAVGVESSHQVTDLIAVHFEAQRVDAWPQLVRVQNAVCIQVEFNHELDVTHDACKLLDVYDAVRILIVLSQDNVCLLRGCFNAKMFEGSPQLRNVEPRAAVLIKLVKSRRQRVMLSARPR